MQRRTAPRLKKSPRLPLDLDKLKALPLIKVGELLGLKIKAGSMRCQLPGHDDKNPSFYYKRKSNTWRCYSCNRGGSTLDLVMAVKHCDLKNAIRFLSGHFDQSGKTTLSPHLPIYRRSPIKKEAPDIEAYKLVRTYISITPELTSYFQRRGVSEKVLREHKVGQLRNPQQLLKVLLTTFGYDRVSKAGLLSTRSNLKKPQFLFPEDAIIFPFFRKGVCEYLQARIINEVDKSKRWLNLNGVNISLFNEDILLDESIKKIYVCEGITDALSATELGKPAIAITGASNGLPEDSLSKLEGKDIYIIPDNDKAGQIFANKIRAQLIKAGITTSFIQKIIPERCKDLNDYLVYIKSQSGEIS